MSLNKSLAENISKSLEDGTPEETPTDETKTQSENNTENTNTQNDNSKDNTNTQSENDNDTDQKTGLETLTPGELVKEVQKWKSTSRKHEARARRRNKSSVPVEKESEENSKELEAALKELEEFKREKIVNTIVSKYNLPENSSRFLNGKTEEELEEQAKTILELVGEGKEQVKNKSNPFQASFSGGAEAGSPGERLAEKFADSLKK